MSDKNDDLIRKFEHKEQANDYINTDDSMYQTHTRTDEKY